MSHSAWVECVGSVGAASLLRSLVLMAWTLLVRSSTLATELRGHLRFVSGIVDN